MSGYELVRVETTPDDNDLTDTEAYAYCPPGKRAIRGGATVFYWTSNGEFSIENVSITVSEPVHGGATWHAVASEVPPGPPTGSGLWTLRATAICVAAE
jgi:hypothetical protein